MKAAKIMSAALALGTAFVLAGCGKDDSQGTSSAETSSGYTTAELADKITIGGVRLKTPMTSADFGEGFTLDSYVQSGDTGSMINIFNDKGIVCALCYNLPPEEVNENAPIDYIMYTPNDFNRDVFSIDGFTANDPIEKLEEKLGKPEKEGLYFYDTTDGGRLEVIDVVGKVHSINFIYNPPRNNKD